VRSSTAVPWRAARSPAETALLALGLAADLTDQYDRRKRELGVLDFNDLLIRARNLLVGPEHGGLRKRLAAQIRLLLVDEFQDTDPLQVELIKALCNNEHLSGKLFFVGDFKQSIYRFRNAQPKVFQELCQEVPAKGQLSLTVNFRSQPAVLDFVNAMFGEELPDYEPLRASRPQIGPTPAVEFLWATDASPLPSGEGQGEGEDESAQPHALTLALSQRERGPEGAPHSDDMGQRERLRRREADWIARRIRAMLDAGEKIVWDTEAAKTDQPTVRAIRPGDVALLFRALTNVEYYEEALRRYRIDYYLVGGRAFYANRRSTIC